jgi:hypothetical protein
LLQVFHEILTLDRAFLSRGLKLHIQSQIHLNSPVLLRILQVIAGQRCRTFVACGFGGRRRSRS